MVRRIVGCLVECQNKLKDLDTHEKCAIQRKCNARSSLYYAILVKIFGFLRVGDLLQICLVCHKWHEIASLLLIDRVAITIAEDVNAATVIFTKSFPNFRHWVFKNVDLDLRGPFEMLWSQHLENIQSLALLDVDISENDLINILQRCNKLEKVVLTGLSHLFMTGLFVENDNDYKLLKKSLQNVNCIRVSCSRYMSDYIFEKIISLIGPLKEISLSSCQISFQNSIWKRFYPNDGSIKSSEHVLTFNNILRHIDLHKETLKNLDLSRTTLDSDSLIKISTLPNLHLESLQLMACYQLTKTGIQVLAQHQQNLIELDISLCSRVTDYAILALADHLPNLKSLNIRRCQSVSEIGMENLARLRNLEKLDISYLDVKNSDSIHEALGKIFRPSLRYLNAAAISIQRETVLALAEMAPNLSYLDLSMCIVGVTDKSLQALCKKLTKLETLYLSGCIGLSDIGLSGYGINVNQPPMMEIAGNELSMEALGLREKNPYKVPLGSKAEQVIRREAEVIKYLENNIEQIIQSSEFGLSHMQKLKHLNICGCVRLTDITLIHALRLVELQFLNLSHCQKITEEGLVQMIGNCPSLEELYLTDCSFTTDHSILVIAHRLKRIKTLDLQRCTLLTNDALDSLCSCHSLRYLDVSGCDKMTLEGIDLLKERIPRLQNLHHRGIKSCEVEEEGQQGRTSWLNMIPTPPPLIAKLRKKMSSF